MKILRVITSMNPEKGGPGQGIRNSITMLDKMGVINEVVCFDDPNSSFLGNDKFLIHAIGPSKGPYQYCLGLTKWLNDNFHRFDKIIIHGVWLHNSYGTYKALQRYKMLHTKAPDLFLMPHGMLDPYFQNAPDRRLKSIRNLLIWELLEKKVVNGVNGILFTCEQELILAKKTFRQYHPKKELNVGYGILPPPTNDDDLKLKFQKQFSILGKSKYWLFLSRIHPKKGVDLLIRAYLLLKKDITLPKLVIAGPGGDTEYGKYVTKLANGDKDIIFSGMISGDMKWGAIYGAEVFILPSHQENFGISVVESMACGTPVIITNQINIWSEIENGIGGIICQDTEEALLEALRKWNNLSQIEKDQFKVGAVTTYLNCFTIEHAAVQLLQKISL